MKVLVTGAAGFIGSHLVERLVRDGDDLPWPIPNKSFENGILGQGAPIYPEDHLWQVLRT